ncbi:HNH endonuclease, partial [Candidatus Saccharibacteria bacterium]|nr:HNH endonuclease [Candidatus Saccharibacteria bacterium]
MRNVHRTRRFIVSLISIVILLGGIGVSQDMWQTQIASEEPMVGTPAVGAASEVLATLPIKGRAPKTGYTRTAFGDGWTKQNGCDTRNIILNRDLTNVEISQDCKVQSGALNDPYTAQIIAFKRGADTSDDVQIDHVVALSDSWQKGAQLLTFEQRQALANDPLELLAVDGSANQNKSDG